MEAVGLWGFNMCKDVVQFFWAEGSIVRDCRGIGCLGLICKAVLVDC
jgi:hypothetical protein